MTVGAIGASALVAASAKRSSAGLSIAITSPGLVQNCPEPIVSDPTKPAASASARASSAAGINTTGLMLLISA